MNIYIAIIVVTVMVLTIFCILLDEIMTWLFPAQPFKWSDEEDLKEGLDLFDEIVQDVYKYTCCVGDEKVAQKQPCLCIASNIVEKIQEWGESKEMLGEPLPKGNYTVTFLVTVECDKVKNKSEALVKAFDLINYASQEGSDIVSISSISMDSCVNNNPPTIALESK